MDSLNKGRDNMIVHPRLSDIQRRASTLAAYVDSYGPVTFEHLDGLEVNQTTLEYAIHRGWLYYDGYYYYSKHDFKIYLDGN